MNKPIIYIRKCFSEYLSTFPDDWIEELKWSNKSESDKSYSEGQKKILDFVKLCFVNIAKSLLCGEYIVSRSKFEETKERFQKYWNKEHMYPEFPDIDPDIKKLKKQLYNSYAQLDKQLKKLFKAYSSFVVSVDEKLDYAKHTYLFKDKHILFKVTRDEASDTVLFRYFSYLHKIFIPLCTMEHYLEFSEGNKKELAVLIEELNYLASRESDPDVKGIMVLATYKARFILKKLLRVSDSFEILVDCEKKVISRNNIGELPEGLSRLFLFYERLHENRPYLNDDISNLQKKIFGKTATFLEIALLMNYYCSYSKSVEQVENLLEDFENILKIKSISLHSDFNNHALCTLQNYMYNCRLVFQLRRDKFSIEDLKKYISEIERIQNRTFIKNFYPYKKALEYLEKTIRKKIEERDLLFEYDEAIELFSQYLDQFHQNVEWCEAHKFYPIQLTFKGCRFKINEYYLFVPSSVTRPIDYMGLREEEVQFNSSLEFFKTSCIYLKDKEDTESIKNELKNIEKRYIGIGSILVGVVTFLFGTIDIFTKSGQTNPNMFQSILGLGLILIIFSCLMILVTELCWGKKNKVHPWRIGILSFLILIYTTIIFILALKH